MSENITKEMVLKLLDERFELEKKFIELQKNFVAICRKEELKEAYEETKKYIENFSFQIRLMEILVKAAQVAAKEREATEEADDE